MLTSKPMQEDDAVTVLVKMFGQGEAGARRLLAEAYSLPGEWRGDAPFLQVRMFTGESYSTWYYIRYDHSQTAGRCT